MAFNFVLSKKFVLLTLMFFTSAFETKAKNIQPIATFTVAPSQLVLGLHFTANCSVTVSSQLIDYFISIDKDGRNLGQWSVFANQPPIWTHMTTIDHLLVKNSTQKYPIFGITGKPLGSRAAGNYSCSVTVTGLLPVTSDQWIAKFAPDPPSSSYTLSTSFWTVTIIFLAMMFLEKTNF